MIDTVVLLLPQDSFQITNPDKFVPNARHDHKCQPKCRSRNPIEAKSNQERISLLAYISQGLHCFITHENKKQVMLRIELSLPKLFYGNNFQELKGKDLQPLLI